MPTRLGMMLCLVSPKLFVVLGLLACHKATQGEPVPSAPAIPDRNVFAYALDDAGGLTPLVASPFPSGGQINDVESLSVIPSRNLLFTANSASNSFSVLKFDPARGELTPVPGSPFRAEGLFPAATAVSGNFLFVANASSNTVSTFRLRDDGVPMRIEGSPAPVGGDFIEDMRVDPLGRFVFVVSGNSSTVSVLRIAPDGTLSPVPGSPFAGLASPDEATIDAAGRLVFVTNRAQSQSSISVFTLGADGQLAAVAGSPFAAPAGFAVFEHTILDRSGTLLIATFEQPPAILSYHVAQNGSLTPVSTPLKLGTPGPGGPEGMAFDPTGRFLYLADHIANRLHVYALDATGALSEVIPGGASIGAEPLDLVIPGWQVGGRPVLLVLAALH